MKRSTLKIASLLACSALVPAIAHAAKKDNSSSSEAVPISTSAPTDAADAAAEQVSVDTIKEKYWARGDTSEMGVVQNRAYTKAHKFSFGVYGGIVATDPFLSVQNAGVNVSYHLSEYIALSGLYWKDFVSKSGALETFERRGEELNPGQGATTNYNQPRYYYGGEVVGSILYGKLSVIGKAIIYYDMNLLGGLGITNTETGNDFTQHIGIGEQVYLSKNFSIRFDYRLMHYKETLDERVITSKLGQPVGTRDNWTNSFALGVQFMFGVSAKDSGEPKKENGKK